MKWNRSFDYRRICINSSLFYLEPFFFWHWRWNLRRSSWCWISMRQPHRPILTLINRFFFSVIFHFNSHWGCSVETQKANIERVLNLTFLTLFTRRRLTVRTRTFRFHCAGRFVSTKLALTRLKYSLKRNCLSSLTLSQRWHRRRSLVCRDLIGIVEQAKWEFFVVRFTYELTL